MWESPSRFRDDILDVTSTLEELGKAHPTAMTKNDKDDVCDIRGTVNRQKRMWKRSLQERIEADLRPFLVRMNFWTELIKSLVYREK